MSVKAEKCKLAIVRFLSDPNEIHKLSVKGIAPPGPWQGYNYDRNWKRISKRKPKEHELVPEGTKTVREFNCRPYENQLRATVYDNGVEILKVVVGTE